MVILAIAMQLAAVQLRPITAPQIYDVDLTVVHANGDTLTMAFLRLADGVEGQLMLSREDGAMVRLRTLVREEKGGRCRTLTVGVGEAAQARAELILVPRTTGQLCENETIRMTNVEGGSTVVARVRRVPPADVTAVRKGP